MTPRPYPHEIVFDGERYMDTATLVQLARYPRNDLPESFLERLDPKGKHVVVRVQALSERVCRVRVKVKLAGKVKPFETVLYGLRGLIDDLPHYRPAHQQVVVPYALNPVRDKMFPEGYQTAPARFMKEDRGS